MNKKENIIDLRRFMRTIKQYRWLLLAVIVAFTSLGIWVGVRSLPKFDIQGQVLIGDNNNSNGGSSAGGMAQMMKTFSVGGFGASTVDNEVLVMQSHDVMLRAVRMLELNRSYIGKTVDGDKAMLYQNTPVRVEAPATHFDTLSIGFNIKINLKENGKVDIKATKGFFKKKLAEAEDVRLPYLLKTAYGDYQIMASNDSVATKSPYTEINVSIAGNEGLAVDLYEDSKIDVATKLSDVINVDYDCANAKLGMAIVNAIMNEYNAKRLERLHDVSRNTVEYYDGRIAEVLSQLKIEEEKVAEYQRKNNLTGVDSELSLLVENSVGSKKEIQEANYNIAYHETVLNILRDRLNDDVIIPQMEALDPNVGEFNGAIQARRDLRRSATDDNEAMKLLNEKIEILRNLIIENSTKMIAKARADVQHKQNLAYMAQSRLDKYPEYSQEFANLLRDKNYLTSLYQYLISERENAVLQVYSTENIGFIFQDAYVLKKPGILKKMIWPAVMFVFASFCCICFVVFMTLMSRKVKDTMDLTFLGIEDKSVKYKGDKESINILRTKIMANSSCRVLYFAPLCGTGNLAEMIKDSFISVGRTVSMVDGLKNNDELITPNVQNSIAQTLIETDYMIVKVPDAENVCDIENLVDADNAALIVGVPSNVITRKHFKEVLKGQTAEKVFTIISA